ncbi:hypothetical protein OG225_11740 [Nocardia sp. NBC_01377]|uniref:hypothetical protein n=1 Tax=Nocardia sp. NBC_01377 TaxID=2903595 RepID=UPI0032510072
MFGLKILGEFAFGIDPRLLVAAGFLLLVLAWFLWEAVATPVYWVLDRLRGPDRSETPEAIRAPRESNSRRTADSRERRSARAAARRATLHTRRTDHTLD